MVLWDCLRIPNSSYVVCVDRLDFVIEFFNKNIKSCVMDFGGSKIAEGIIERELDQNPAVVQGIFRS